MQRLTYDNRAVSDFCRRNGIRRLAFFGSLLRDDFRPESDVDVLVTFEPDANKGFLSLARMERELTAIIGRQVDLRTAAELSPYFRAEVLAEAEVQFEEG